MSELRFDGRVAIVTGAGGGLGRGYAHLLAARGAQVVVNDSGGSVNGEGTSSLPAETVAKEIAERGGVAVAETSSVASSEGGAAIVAKALESFGRLDIVVSNAGILRDKAFHNMTAEMFDAVYAVHLRGAFNVLQPAFVHMRKQGHGRIVVATSSAGTYGNFGQVNYSAMKMALVGLAKTISIEGARFDVKANAIAPTALTRMTEGLVGDLGAELGPERVAPAVAWLCHESCSLAGEVLVSAAGRVARTFVAETKGYYDPSLTLEGVAEHMPQILETQGFAIPRAVGDASALLAQALRGGKR
jgi:NAD(P)-dependent dehydrogenase (short-subunit alcohol dehydrogenase family)